MVLEILTLATSRGGGILTEKWHRGTSRGREMSYLLLEEWVKLCICQD